MKKLSFVAFLLLMFRYESYAQAIITINNHTSYDIYAEVEGIDDPHFGSGSQFKSNVIFIAHGGTVSHTPCMVEVTYGWASIWPSAYGSVCLSSPPTTAKWFAAKITSPSWSGCTPQTWINVEDGTPCACVCDAVGCTAGPNYTSCGSGGPSATWSTTSACSFGADVTIDVYP